MKNSILSFLGVLALALLIVPSFLSSKFTMSRSIEIHAPLSLVFTKLTDLNEYVKWNPFPEGDPTNQATVAGEGIGSSLIWKGGKTGEGQMTISEIEPESNVTVQMEFYKPMSGTGLVHWTTTASSDSVTELVWSFEQELPYFNRYFGLIMDSMMGKHFEKGLQNYKTLIEASN